GDVVVGGCGAAMINNCSSSSATLFHNNPAGPNTRAPGGWFAAIVPCAPRVTPNCKPVGSAPLTAITSESTEMQSRVPPGIGVSSTICVSVTLTLNPSEDRFGTPAPVSTGGGRGQSCCWLSIQNLRPFESISVHSAHRRHNRDGHRIVGWHVWRQRSG